MRLTIKKKVIPLKSMLCAQAPLEKSALAANKRVVWDKAAFEALLRRGEFSKALELVRHLRRNWPDNPSFLHALALLESRVEGRKGEQQARLLFEEACQVFLQGDKELAKRMFLTCHHMQPEAWVARFNLSRLKYGEYPNLS